MIRPLLNILPHLNKALYTTVWK